MDTSTAVISAATLTAAGVANGNTLTVAADVITGFSSGDKIKFTAITGGVINLFGLGTGNDAGGDSNADNIAADSILYVQGNFSSGVFTVQDTGSDTLVIRNDAAIAGTAGGGYAALTAANLGAAANTSVVVLSGYTGFGSSDIIA